MINSEVPVQAAMAPPAAIVPKRYLTLDAYRGFVMIVLVSESLGFRHVTGSPICQRIGTWFQHSVWQGSTLWDLVAPAFLLVVGVAMPFSLARREEAGAGFRGLLGHVSWRALRLLLLSQIIMCLEKNRLHIQFINILAVIAFAYFFSFLIFQLQFRWQVLAAVALLAGYWLLYVLFPGPEGPFSQTGNIGARIDDLLLGSADPGKYTSINFITSIVTTLFGVWVGMLWRSRRTEKEKLKILSAFGILCFACAFLLSALGNPIVKRLWTSSWTLYSAGWVLLSMVVFYWVIEIRQLRRWTLPFVVVGINSIFIYTTNEILRGCINKSLAVFTRGCRWIGDPAPIAQSCTVLLVLYCVCHWLYRRGIFFKL